MFGLAKLDFVVLESKMSKIAYIYRERERRIQNAFLSSLVTSLAYFELFQSSYHPSATHDFEV
jgi:hypothetical protein